MAADPLESVERALVRITTHFQKANDGAEGSNYMNGDSDVYGENGCEEQLALQNVAADAFAVLSKYRKTLKAK